MTAGSAGRTFFTASKETFFCNLNFSIEFGIVLPLVNFLCIVNDFFNIFFANMTGLGNDCMKEYDGVKYCYI